MKNSTNKATGTVFGNRKSSFPMESSTSPMHYSNLTKENKNNAHHVNDLTPQNKFTNKNNNNPSFVNPKSQDGKLLTTNVFINNLNIQIKSQAGTPLTNKRIAPLSNSVQKKILKNSPFKFATEDRLDDHKDLRITDSKANNNNNHDILNDPIKPSFNSTLLKPELGSNFININQRKLFKAQDFIKSNITGTSKTPDYLTTTKFPGPGPGPKSTIISGNTDNNAIKSHHRQQKSVEIATNPNNPKTSFIIKRDQSPLSGSKIESLNFDANSHNSSSNKSPFQEKNLNTNGTTNIGKTIQQGRPSSKHKKAPSYDINVNRKIDLVNKNLIPNFERTRRSADQGDLRSSGLLQKEPPHFKIAFRTRAGVLHNGMKKINQDSFIMIQNYGKKRDRCLLSVCDGHGANGHFISGFIKETLPPFLLADPSFESDPKLAFVNAYELCNQKLLNTDIDAKFSGSTSVSLLIDNDHIISANIGDSRAIMASFKKGSLAIHLHIKPLILGWEYTQLSYDHKPNSMSEAQRILRAGGRIEPFRDADGNFVGPSRVWLMHQDIPGLAMSRSIGDVVAAAVGVTCQPEIKEFKITSDDKFIIIASDGVWEFITNIDVVKIVAPFYEQGDIEGACDSLLAQSLKRWSEEEENIVDDITLLILFLQYNT